MIFSQFSVPLRSACYRLPPHTSTIPRNPLPIRTCRGPFALSAHPRFISNLTAEKGRAFENDIYWEDFWLSSTVIKDQFVGYDVGDEGDRDIATALKQVRNDNTIVKRLDPDGPDYDSVRCHLDIQLEDHLHLKPNIEERLKESKSIGNDATWSSNQLYHHLGLLTKLVPESGTIGSRQWIEAFLFRASVMVPPGKRMVLGSDIGINALPINPSSLVQISGSVDYMAFLENDDPRYSTFDPSWEVESNSNLSTGLVIMAGTEESFYHSYKELPQALCTLYVLGRNLRKTTIRGVLTNGQQWVFILLRFNKNGEGASCKLSQTFCCPSHRYKLEEPGPDIIAGILSHWMQRSFQDIDEDDWLEGCR